MATSDGRRKLFQTLQVCALTLGLAAALAATPAATEANVSC
jgi:hypothetical protein